MYVAVSTKTSSKNLGMYEYSAVLEGETYNARRRISDDFWGHGSGEESVFWRNTWWSCNQDCEGLKCLYHYLYEMDRTLERERCQSRARVELFTARVWGWAMSLSKCVSW
jgi:hypothetical protein